MGLHSAVTCKYLYGRIAAWVHRSLNLVAGAEASIGPGVSTFDGIVIMLNMNCLL